MCSEIKVFLKFKVFKLVARAGLLEAFFSAEILLSSLKKGLKN
jgi:hypothetical protein